MFRPASLLFSLAIATLGNAVAHANDVQVTITSNSNPDVVITGDDDGNSVRISYIFQTLHVIQGLDGTTINGSSSSIVLPVQDDVRINLEDGDDQLEITSLSAHAVSHAEVVIELGAGNDELLVTDLYARDNLYIETDTIFSSGNDDVDLQDFQVNGVLVVDLYDGDDCCLVLDGTGLSLAWIVADGTATILCQRNDVDEIFIDSGEDGADKIRVFDNTTETIEVRTSDFADDVLVLQNAIWSGDGIVELGGGNDDLDFRWNTLGSWGWAPSYVISGGNGRDTGIIADNGWFTPIVFLFEGTVR